MLPMCRSRRWRLEHVPSSPDHASEPGQIAVLSTVPHMSPALIVIGPASRAPGEGKVAEDDMRVDTARVDDSLLPPAAIWTRVQSAPVRRTHQQ
jgi:hypothetical protein